MKVSMDGMRQNLLRAYHGVVQYANKSEDLYEQELWEDLRTAINSFMFISDKDNDSFNEMSDYAIPQSATEPKL